MTKSVVKKLYLAALKSVPTTSPSFQTGLTPLSCIPIKYRPISISLWVLKQLFYTSHCLI